MSLSLGVPARGHLQLAPPTPTSFVLIPGAPSTASPPGVLTSFSPLFSQSLKSDEDAESPKEPQNELFEAQGNPWLHISCRV